MRSRGNQSNLGVLLVLVVFAVFMVSVLMVLLTGADVVKGITARGQASFEERTAVQYLTTRIRQADEVGRISVRTAADGDRLVLAEQIDDARYETVVYCYDGYLREMFCAAGYDPGPEYGEKILPAESLRVQDGGSYLEMEITFADGQRKTVICQIRSERGAES